MKYILAPFLILTCFLATAQKEIPKDYFDNPLKIPLVLSGSFGELRSNHFHSGMDIKTQQREGVAIYAPADGYVSRIKVGHFGFGKALYIKHPNGYSTVYAHLQKFEGDIENYVKKSQYKKESYEIELFPDAAKLAVKKGDIIGYTGNSGSSGGPHLHFEIRDAASRPMNPMEFGINIPDSKKPVVNSLWVYPQGNDAHVNQNQKPQKLRLTRKKDGSYVAEKVKGYGKIGFGVSSNDGMDGASNKNGVYQIRSAYNGIEKINILFQKFSFSETRYLNRFIDYGYFKENKSRIQKLFREANNPLSIFKNEDDNGFITLEDQMSGTYSIEICDYQDNKIMINIPIEGSDQPYNGEHDDTSEMDLIVSNGVTNLTKGKFKIYVPTGALYEDTFMNIEARGDTLKFHKDVVPIHKNITIKLDASDYQKEDFSKLYLGRLNWKGEPYYSSTKHANNELSIRVRTLGNYSIAYDKVAPKIVPVNFSNKKWISKNKTLKIKITDQHSGISSYRATINGKYILTEYDYKKNVLTYNFDDAIVDETDNNLKVIVTDNVGNSTTFEATFFRKQS